MPFLLAQDVRNIENRFVELLRDIPGDREDKQRYFESLKIAVPRTNYLAMWQRLVDRVGRASAGEAVFECLLYFADERLKELLLKARQGFTVRLRKSEPKTVIDLFYRNGNPKRLGELVVMYVEASGNAGILRTEYTSRPARLSEASEFYDVALSFAGENRKIADELARALRDKGVGVFYDRFRKGDLWGKKLTTHFQDVYGPRARFVIVLISEHYPIKDWTDYEFSIAKKEAKVRNSEFILPVRLDDTKILGIHEDVGYLDFEEEGIEGIVQHFLEKVSRHEISTSTSYLDKENMPSKLMRKRELREYLEDNLLYLIEVLDVTDLDQKVTAVNLITKTRNCAIGILEKRGRVISKRDWVLLRDSLKEAKRMEAYNTIRDNRDFLNEFFSRLEGYLR